MYVYGEKKLSKDEVFSALEESKLFRDFSRKELNEMFSASSLEAQIVKKGTMLVDVNEPVQRVGIVVAGYLIEQRSGGSTKTHSFNRFDVGATFGLEAFFSGPRTSPVEVIAGVDTGIIWFDISPLLGNDKYKDRIFRAILLSMANNSVRHILNLDVLQSTTIREQIMTYFKIMSDKHGSDTFQIELTQTELADYFGVNRSALSREINLMQREGILEILPQRRYHIMKWKRTPAKLKDTKVIENEIGK